MDELVAKLHSWATSGVKPGTADSVAMLRQVTPEEKTAVQRAEVMIVGPNVVWRNRRTGSSWTWRVHECCAAGS